MRVRASIKPFFAAGALAAAVSPAIAQAIDPNSRTPVTARSEWRASVGTNYSTGHYGEAARTGVFSFPIAVKYARGPLALRASLSALRIAGPADILEVPQGRRAFGAEAEAAANGSPPTKDRRVGRGDLRLSAIYSFDLGRDWYVDASTALKMPTASSRKRLGTGRLDAEVGAELVKEAGDASFYAGARRTFAGIGSAVGGLDTWGAGVGASYWLSESMNAGVDYDWEQASITGDKPSSEATLWAGFRLSQRLRASVYAARGLNGDSADFAAGLTLSWRLD